jgi:hypothetical protein
LTSFASYNQSGRIKPIVFDYFFFLLCKDVESYLWAVNNLNKHIWRPQRIPAVFITNRDLALRSALTEVFLDLQANLCTRNLNKHITTHCKKILFKQELQPQKEESQSLEQLHVSLGPSDLCK